jgi:hypothetical protein
VQASDTRLSDARTPTTHTHDDRYFTETEVTTSLSGKSDTGHTHTGTYAPASHSHAIADIPVAASGVSDVTKVVRSDDSRLSDARTPAAHNHDGGAITSGTVANTYLPTASTTAKGIAELALSSETAAGLVVQASDTRLSDARTPTAHHTSHNTGQSDAIAPADIGAAAASHTHTVANITNFVYAPLAMSFSQNGDIYFVAHAAMTLAAAQEAGTGTMTYNVAVAATPTSFSTATFPLTMAQGDILKVTCASISTYKALTFGRTA